MLDVISLEGEFYVFEDVGFDLNNLNLHGFILEF